MARGRGKKGKGKAPKMKKAVHVISSDSEHYDDGAQNVNSDDAFCDLSTDEIEDDEGDIVPFGARTKKPYTRKATSPVSSPPSSPRRSPPVSPPRSSSSTSKSLRANKKEKRKSGKNTRREEALNLTEDEERDLASWFESNEILYDMTRDDYKMKSRKDRLWMEKADEMGYPCE